MAKRKAVENSGSDTAATPDDATDKAQPVSELPTVASPSISPATGESAVETSEAEASAESAPAAETASEPEDQTPAASASIRFPRLSFRPRHKRYAVLAACVAISTAFGAMVGSATTGGFARAPAVDTAAVEDNKATQQSVARLAKEIAGLKASLEAANKSAHTQIAKLSDRLSRETAEVTGGITPPQTVPPAGQQSPPLPAPRPAQAAAGETPPPARLAIVPDWSIRETRDGYVYVQGHGDIYQVMLGAPLPGLGPVEQIKRQDGRWLVVTPKGIIVSMRDRRYFQQF
ncbi:MAG TPA: hypothetical protein VIV34_04975 [Pseudolabrys sp.]